MKLLGERIYSMLAGWIYLIYAFLHAYYRMAETYLEDRLDKSSPYYKPISRMWRMVFRFLVFACIYLFVVETNFLFLTGEMPGIQELQDPKLAQGSEIYSSDGELLGRFYAENRIPVKSYKDLSPYLVEALVSTEDARFYEHSGIDLKAWVGVAKGIVLGGDRGGGSTITQQLAKNLFQTRVKKGFFKTGILGYIPLLNKFIYKSKEWVTAIKLERNFTKEEIILWYLNTVDFGSNNYGIKIAAQRYFNTTPDQLSITEAAVLVGLQKATWTYNPRRYIDKPLSENKSWQRRNVVLANMVRYGYLDGKEFAELAMSPIVLKEYTEVKSDSDDDYYKTAILKYIEKWAEENDVDLDLYRDGLKIVTTIDSRMQNYAQEALRESMRNTQRTFDYHIAGSQPWVDENKQVIPGFIDSLAKKTPRFKQLLANYQNLDSAWYHYKNDPHEFMAYSRNKEGYEKMYLSSYDSLAYYKHFLQAGMMTMDPVTGQIKAWVGGLNYEYFKYDHVNQARRQPGSTFKPFVYLAAIDGPRDLDPCYLLKDEYFEVEVEENGEKKLWKPRNADWTFSNREMPIKRGLIKSLNTITAKLTMLVGPDTVQYYAEKMGIKSSMKPVPSIGLGSFDVNLEEMVASYTPFINEGVHVEPLLIMEIKDRNGKLIHRFEPKTQRVIRKESALLMRNMLEGVIYEGGTGSALLWGEGEALLPKKDRYSPAYAGKTGTSSNHSDGWFIGMSHRLITGVWVGGEDRAIHFRSGEYGEGSKTALPIYRKFMLKVVKDPSLEEFRPIPFPKFEYEEVNKDFNCNYFFQPPADTTLVDSSLVVPVDSLAGINE